jgi:hypothetical protein
VLQVWPLLHERHNCVVADEEQHRLARGKRQRRISRRLAPTPLADRKTKQPKIVLKMTGKSAVADDANGRRLAEWYLSHGSGPSKNGIESSGRRGFTIDAATILTHFCEAG